MTDHPIADFSRILDQAHIPELPNPYFGKVRDCYDLPEQDEQPARRILISTDRLSAIDRILTSGPFKGQVLTQMARFWFDHTGDLCPNHVLSYPDPNVVIGQRLTILPVEIVVRGYLAGTTSTSVLTRYRQGQRQMYGHILPDGLRDNQVLAQAIITPTSKAFDGGHDEPLTAAQIVNDGLLTADQWAQVSACALALLLTALNKVDLPTLGRPTMPACNAILFIFLPTGRLRGVPVPVFCGCKCRCAEPNLL